MVYNSTITNHTEFLPVSVDILGKKVYNFSGSLSQLRALHVSTRSSIIRLTPRSLAAKGWDDLIFQLFEDVLAPGVVSVTEAGQTITGGEVLVRKGRGA